jgi:hypothetical protein
MVRAAAIGDWARCSPPLPTTSCGNWSNWVSFSFSFALDRLSPRSATLRMKPQHDRGSSDRILNCFQVSAPKTFRRIENKNQLNTGGKSIGVAPGVNVDSWDGTPTLC